VSLQRDIDGPDPLGREPAVRIHEERRRTRSGRLGMGTLACPRCDAPVALGPGPAAPADPLGCPFCGHAARVREFLTLGDPVRPARVEVRVVETFRRA
jgi:hypothetical protein